jgi:two-component system chemotaxis response regulator CheY
MGLNVLVVDDSGVMRSMIIKTLRLSGISLASVTEAANGVEALEIINKGGVDLALVDLNMPVMGGDELIERLRAQEATRDLPVVVVSTEGSFTRISLLRKKGAGFVHKPFTPEILRQTLAEMVGSSDDNDAGREPVPGDGPDA